MGGIARLIPQLSETPLGRRPIGTWLYGRLEPAPLDPRDNLSGGLTGPEREQGPPLIERWALSSRYSC